MPSKESIHVSDIEPEIEHQTPRKKIGFKGTLLVILVVLVASGAYGSWYFYHKYKTLKTNPNAEAQKQTADYVSKISKLMELPKDETPTVATISDKEKLKDQPFFKTAENGDVLLAYTKAMQAVLYRPATNKIINVAPISINQPEATAPVVPGSQTAGVAASLRIAYFNGTGTGGLSGLAQKSVQEKYPSFQTATLANASRKDYKGTLVVDLSGIHNKEAGDLARLLGGTIGTLPDGENRPDADILIISGK